MSAWCSAMSAIRGGNRPDSQGVEAERHTGKALDAPGALLYRFEKLQTSIRAKVRSWGGRIYVWKA